MTAAERSSTAWLATSNHQKWNKFPRHVVIYHFQAITIQHDRSEIAVDMLLTIVTVYPVPGMQLADPRRRRSGADVSLDWGPVVVKWRARFSMSAVKRELPELELAGVRRKNM